jgi:hypothetical protein
VSFVALWWGGPALGAAYAVATSAAILITLTAVNLVLVLLAPPFEQKAEKLRDAWLPILLALGLTTLEIAAAAWLRLVLLSLVAGR